jgi:translation initiation factor IF-3
MQSFERVAYVRHPLFCGYDTLFFTGGVFTISRDSLRINGEIRIREVRVTSATGEQLGIMPTREAQRLAEEQHLDLVEVAPKAKPPVCRIMDFGKYRYEQQKREKEARKKQKVITIKEVKLRPHIEQHDFDVKLKNAVKFLGEGNKVKVTIMFRGRELSHPELGKEVLARVADVLGDTVSIERGAKLEGRNMTMIVAPKAQKSSGKNKKKQQQEKPATQGGNTHAEN